MSSASTPVSPDKEYAKLTSITWGIGFMKSLDVMRKSQDLCDVQILLKDTEEPTWAHSCALAVASPFLKSMLVTSKETPKILNLASFPSEIVRQILQFIYTGSATVRRADLLVFHGVCASLNVLGLTEMALNLIQNNLRRQVDAVKREEEKPETPDFFRSIGLTAVDGKPNERKSRRGETKRPTTRARSKSKTNEPVGKRTRSNRLDHVTETDAGKTPGSTSTDNTVSSPEPQPADRRTVIKLSENLTVVTYPNPTNKPQTTSTSLHITPDKLKLIRANLLSLRSGTGSKNATEKESELKAQAKASLPRVVLHRPATPSKSTTKSADLKKAKSAPTKTVDVTKTNSAETAKKPLKDLGKLAVQPTVQKTTVDHIEARTDVELNKSAEETIDATDDLDKSVCVEEETESEEDMEAEELEDELEDGETESEHENEDDFGYFEDNCAEADSVDIPEESSEAAIAARNVFLSSAAL